MPQTFVDMAGKQKCRLEDREQGLRLGGLGLGQLGQRHGRDVNLGLELEVLGGRRREVSRLQAGRLARRLRLRLLSLGTGTMDQGLGLGGVVTQVLLGQVGGLLRVLLSGRAELSSLGVDKVAGLLELVVDELLVGGVDERSKEDDGGADHGQSPVRDDLDQVVREEGGESDLVWSAN